MPRNGRPANNSLLRKVFSITFLVIVIVVIVVVMQNFGGMGELQSLVRRAGSWAPIVYIALKSLTFVIAPISGVSLKIFAGALFGIQAGIIYSLIGDLVGGSINFWIARLLGQRAIEKFAGQKGIARVEKLRHQLGGWRALLFARVILSAVYDFVSYAAGLSDLPFLQYLIVSTLGGVVSTAFWTTLGANLTENLELTLLILGAIVLLVWLVNLLRRRKHCADRRTNL